MGAFRMAVGVVCAAALCAQPAAQLFEKAPPDVEEALRERVRIFYQAHVDGKFRLADAVVHEDSKDAFFAAEKTQYKGFEILRISYSENFTRARVVTVVVTDFALPGFAVKEARVPMTTQWKLDGGQWWWYVEPRTGARQTPFGLMKPGEGSASEPPFAILRKMPTVEEIQAQVEVDRTEVQLTGPGAGEVVVTNRMPGPVTLELEVPSGAAFEARIEQAELAAGGRTRVLFEAKPTATGQSRAEEVRLRVAPINRVIAIRVLTGEPGRPAAAPGHP